MCFLYRQSISIVYESKFKYIYRYFIKIDRCFCGILQSLPLRKCGLKYLLHLSQRLIYIVTSLAEVWIEILTRHPVDSSSSVTSLAEVWIEILSRSTYGNPRSKCYHHKYYKDLLKSLDLPDIHFHQLRNTYATILLKNSFNSKGVSHL